MTVHIICDVCKSIIYDEKDCALLDFSIINRYDRLQNHDYQLHVCKGCDMKVAKALEPLLPRVAYSIEPNAKVK